VIEQELQRSYLDYAMSVIVGRALPSVRDGLKPVHRRLVRSCHSGGGSIANVVFLRACATPGEYDVGSCVACERVYSSHSSTMCRPRRPAYGNALSTSRPKSSEALMVSLPESLPTSSPHTGSPPSLTTSIAGGLAG